MQQTLHPRAAQHRRYWRRRQYEMSELRPGVMSSQRVRADRPMWLDYYPWVPGTIGEKMVFAELARRRITFYFGGYWGDMPFTDEVYEHYRPDFILPEYRIIIEVFGHYWHTIPGQSDRDARKAAMYEASGYRHYFLWDYELFRAGAGAAIDAAIPELRRAQVRTGQIFVSDRPFDPTAALRARARRPAKVVRTKMIGPGPWKRPQVPLSIRELHLRPPKKTREERTPGFAGLPERYKSQMRQYSIEWRNYIKKLGAFFEKYGDRARKKYPKEYRYWLRWREWWTKWQEAMFISPGFTEWMAQLSEYFARYPSARYYYASEYYRWLMWRRVGYRRL